MTLTCDRSELERFVRTVFAHAAPQSEIDLRAFYDAKATRAAFRRKRIAWDPVKVIDAAATLIDDASLTPEGVVFCPPVCTFKPGTTQARENDVFQGVAISIELDREPSAALKKAVSVIGPPTLVVASGGVWHDEVFDEDQDKLHVYWVLSAPATGDSELTKLKHARRLLTGIVSGDASNIPLVHPIRWPGSWHRKDIKNPRLCRIVEANEVEVDLPATIQKLETAAQNRGMIVRTGQLGERVDDRETEDLVANIASGEEFHPSLVPLAMRLAIMKVPQELTMSLLKGAMRGSGGPSDPRWATRASELPSIVGSAYAKVEFDSAPAWMQTLHRNDNGVIMNDWENLQTAMTRSPEFQKARLRFNSRARRLEVAGRLWRDTDITQTCAWLNSLGFNKVKANDVARTADLVGQANSYDPLADYLNGLEWDGEPRIEAWLHTYCRAPASLYTREVGSKWLIQAVARALRPGCKADCVLILEGAQGIRKSTALSVLGGPFFTELTADISHGNKDMLMALSNAWIVEMSELDAMRKADIARIKAFFSQAVDRYRAPYEKVTEDHPRSVVFAGTMNPDGNPYLQDTTGNRRFWPVEMGNLIDTDALARDRDQLWAEATARFKKGEKWYLSDRTVIEAAASEQAQRAETAMDDAWYGPVRGWLEAQIAQGVLTTSNEQICLEGLRITTDKVNRGVQMRVAKILRELGAIKKHTEKGKLWVIDHLVL
jgi:predicted P-loop ATPase